MQKKVQKNCKVLGTKLQGISPFGASYQHPEEF